MSNRGHFGRTHADIRSLSNGFYDAVTGNHENLRGDFQADAEGQDGTTDEQDHSCQRPGMALKHRQKRHIQVEGNAENNADTQLKASIGWNCRRNKAI